jgi:Holliday junction resolvase
VKQLSRRDGAMSNVSKGHNFEREVKKMWEGLGFNVTRAAASQSDYDLVATKITQNNIKKVYCVVLMQCKIKKRRRAKARR